MKKVLIKLLDEGVNKGVFPGAVAAVSKGVGRQRKDCFASVGIQDMRYPEQPMLKKTFFDLASLTKALSTTLIVYSLLYEKRIKLSDKLSLFFNCQINEFNNINIEHLLTHSSGIKGYYPFYTMFIPENDDDHNNKILKLILNEYTIFSAGEKCLYSDFGFILLGNIIQKITGLNLQQLFLQYISNELSIDDHIFFNTKKNIYIKKSFASTEKCPWRGRIMRGEVHDEHCWLMGGVAGHAGLFGDGQGVLELCYQILSQWVSGHSTYSWSHMLKSGLKRRYKEQTWALGFDTPSSVGSSAGKKISPLSVGHLGFTGTSFWIDPEKELVMVLLSNRVHPSRANTKIKKYRPYFHTKIISTLQQ